MFPGHDQSDHQYPVSRSTQRESLWRLESSSPRGPSESKRASPPVLWYQEWGRPGHWLISRNSSKCWIVHHSSYCFEHEKQILLHPAQKGLGLWCRSSNLESPKSTTPATGFTKFCFQIKISLPSLQITLVGAGFVDLHLGTIKPARSFT